MSNMNQAKPPMLSKSRFLAGSQCQLRLWHQCYNRELASEISPAQQAIFDAGQEVGRLATRLYPGGVLIEEDHLHHHEAVQSTLAAIDNPEIPAVFEAAFVYDDVRIRADILQRLGDGRWNLIEVKSATSVKEVYLPDVAVQCYVLIGSGLEIADAGILHLNNKYVYDGVKVELANLFTFSYLTEPILSLQQELPLKLAELKEMLEAQNPPQIVPSRHCLSPYPCEFWDHCTAEMPEFWVMGLTGIREERLNELTAMGVEDIRHIPKVFTLSELQERIRTCVVNHEDYLAAELEEELTNLEYPVHFLDFETVSPAIPIYPDTRPYQAIPFQWSDHVLSGGGDLHHFSFIFSEDGDPREDFTASLLKILGEGGTICTYSNYERRVVSELAERLPEQRDRLLATLDRFRDLQALIKRYFYNPGFRGSFSLKSVLPVLVPHMSYENLLIQEGTHASLEYLRMLNPETPPEQRRIIEQALIDYCGYDTLAMVKIRETLLKRF
jgi:predicted RecB family nuclease